MAATSTAVLRFVCSNNNSNGYSSKNGTVENVPKDPLEPLVVGFSSSPDQVPWGPYCGGIPATSTGRHSEK
uniref:Uncharacterized protein n=1 Tax=Anopheles albimanus TaxID=7167 RepID=A0A182F4Y8_ANOAL